MKRCLIVDDSSVIRKVTHRILESMRYKVAEAENGQEALDRLRVEMPDVILVDSCMPLMGGQDFLAALREFDPKPRPFVVYCTSEYDTADLSRALAAGADDFLMKPYDREALETKFADFRAIV